MYVCMYACFYFFIYLCVCLYVCVCVCVCVCVWVCVCVCCCVCIFFFQAEDGIRDLTVTGVQTCALPILGGDDHRAAGRSRPARGDGACRDREGAALRVAAHRASGARGVRARAGSQRQAGAACDPQDFGAGADESLRTPRQVAAGFITQVRFLRHDPSRLPPRPPYEVTMRARAAAVAWGCRIATLILGRASAERSVRPRAPRPCPPARPPRGCFSPSRGAPCALEV